MTIFEGRKQNMSKKESKMMRRRLANAYLSSIVSISLVLLLIGVASLLIVNAKNVSDYFKESMQVSAILVQDSTDEDAARCAQQIAGLPFVKQTRTVTREEGTDDLVRLLGEDFLSVFETSPVPVSVDVTLKADYVSKDSLDVVTTAIQAVPGVEEVSCQQSLVEALGANLAKISLVLGVFILLMLFISFVLINNTVRLNVYARRFTVQTMKLVGATRSFICRPFLVKAVWQGLISSLLACLFLGVLLLFLRRSFSQFFSVFQPSSLILTVVMVVFCGVAICVLSTFFVVGRLISLDKDDLYY